MDKTLDKENEQEKALASKQASKAHCLFEQSGTFKNEFIKLGIPAYDYDILNDYGETDYQIDLFSEIENGYAGKPSIFDNISKDDYVLAFFPCTKFEDQAILGFRGDRFQMANYTDKQKLEYDIAQHSELHRNYTTITKLAIICIARDFKLIIENPYSTQHYLTRYWAIKPMVIDKDRRENGDIYRKPTQYWFIGTKPKFNIVFKALDYVETVNALQKITGRDGKRREVLRSEIHPQYANRFIRQYLLDCETGSEQKQFEQMELELERR
jgi:hypothetical protein